MGLERLPPLASDPIAGPWRRVDEAHVGVQSRDRRHRGLGVRPDDVQSRATGEGGKQVHLDGILATVDLEEAVTHGDLVVEAGERTGAERRALFLRVGESCRASALVATCRGSPDELMDWMPQPGRLFRLRMSESRPSIEPGVETSADAVERAREFAERL